MQKPAALVVLAATIIAAGPRLAHAQEPSWMRGLDALLSAEVTSVSRKEQRLADTSAAVYVLTREDIRRSGMRTVPDVLRLVPGLHVAQATGSRWAVSSRGMGGIYAKHLLVMVDGRSIYTPYFAGVFWDAVDVPVDLIERIEVIRGPGASLWGANAVNGVINIITTSDVVRRETTVTGAAGSKNFGTVVHGGRLGDLFGFRLFANATEHTTLGMPDGGDANDGWRDRSMGGSFQGTLNGRDTLEGGGRAFASRSNSMAGVLTDLAPYTFVPSTIPVNTDIWTASLRWTRQLTGGGHLQTEVWTDEWWREDEAYDHHRRSTELSFQYRPGVRGRHDLLVGAGYRTTNDTSRGSLWTSLDPERDRHTQTSAYAQDEIAIGARGHLVVGTKVEHRDHVGWNAQPTARLHWRFTPTRAAWAAVSRAMRAPDRVEQDVYMNAFGWHDAGFDWVFSIHGNTEIEPEWLTAYEAGYRMVVAGALTVDLAAYFNQYTNMMTFVGEMVPRFNTYQGRGYLEFPSTYANLMSAATAGGEAVAVYAPEAPWKVTGSYSLFTYEPSFQAPAIDWGTDGGATPRHQAQVRYSIDLPRAVSADMALFTVGAMPEPAFEVPAHARLDARIAWQPKAPVELSLVMQNLTGETQPELAGFFSAVTRPSRVPRSAYGAVRWSF